MSRGVRGRLAAVKRLSSSVVLLRSFPSRSFDSLLLLLAGGVGLQEAVVAEAVQREVELLCVSELQLHGELEEEPQGCRWAGGRRQFICIDDN